MPEKEAKARIKINKLLEEAGWRLVDGPGGKANVVFESHVKITQKMPMKYEGKWQGISNFILIIRVYYFSEHCLNCTQETMIQKLLNQTYLPVMNLLKADIIFRKMCLTNFFPGLPVKLFT